VDRWLVYDIERLRHIINKTLDDFVLKNSSSKIYIDRENSTYWSVHYGEAFEVNSAPACGMGNLIDDIEFIEFLEKINFDHAYASLFHMVGIFYMMSMYNFDKMNNSDE
jgi:hypothetical protein